MLRILTRKVAGLLLAAALAGFAVAPAQAGQMTLTGISCSSLVVSGGPVNWNVACASMTCSLSTSNPNPAPGSSVTLTAACDSGANSYSYTTTTPAAGCGTPSGSGTTATVSEGAARNCTYQVTGTNTTTQQQGQASVAVNWSVGAPAAPTGCTAGGNPTTFTSAGGTISLSASCQSPASGVVWSWTRNNVAGWSSQQNPTDALPANTTSSAVNYTYQAKACNGADTFNGANCVLISPSVAASVAASGGGGGGGIACQGFPATQVVDMAWANNTIRPPAFSQQDAVVLRFTTGPASPNIVQFSGAELGSAQTGHAAVLSPNSCDFATSPPTLPGLFTVSYGSTVNIYFTVGANPYGYTALSPNTTYYINLKTDVGGCSTCTMVYTLIK